MCNGGASRRARRGARRHAGERYNCAAASVALRHLGASPDLRTATRDEGCETEPISGREGVGEGGGAGR
jgi:hypothetical protein